MQVLLLQPTAGNSNLMVTLITNQPLNNLVRNSF